MSDELASLAFKQAQAAEFLERMRIRVRQIDDARADSRLFWNDECAREMEKAYLTPINLQCERLAAGLSQVAEAGRLMTEELKGHAEKATSAMRVVAEIATDMEKIERGIRDAEYQQDHAAERLEQASDALKDVDALLARLPKLRL
jgi:methyl-accepting chemotaxis protein